MKKFLVTILTAACLLMLCGCGEEKRSLTVFNYGMYIDTSVLKQFTEETGIKIKYEEASTPEEMYSKYASGAINYDLMCTSDYMLNKLREDGELMTVDFSSFEHAANIGQDYWDMCKAFDPDNNYVLPYFWGTLGILYDTTRVSEPVTSWDVLFSGEYAGEIIMQNSMRDSFYIATKYLGYSLNTKDKDELLACQQLLIAQKDDVQSYLVDEVRDEIVAGNAIMGVIYNGEAYIAKGYNADLEYCIPSEGTNIWIDGWVVPKTCQDYEAACLFLDFLCREDIAMANFEEVCYSPCNLTTIANMPEDMQNEYAINPPMEDLATSETNTITDEDYMSYLDQLWKEFRNE